MFLCIFGFKSDLIYFKIENPPPERFSKKNFCIDQKLPAWLPANVVGFFYVRLSLVKGRWVIGHFVCSRKSSGTLIAMAAM
jgi:hypothetical protein